MSRRTPIGISRRRLLTVAVAGAAAAMGSCGSAPARPRRLVVVFADGGWDVSFAMDPKYHTDVTQGPEVDEDPFEATDREALQTIHGIPVATNEHKRPSVSRLFERYGDRCAVINGIWMGSISHEGARARALTGGATERSPAWATVVGAALGAELPLGALDLSIGSYAGDLAASMGTVGRHGQLRTLLVPGESFPPAEGPPLPLQPVEGDHDRLVDHLLVRNRAFRKRIAARGSTRLVDHREEALVRARRLRRLAADTLSMLRLGRAPAMGVQVEIALDLLEADVCRAVTLGPHFPWDTHSDNSLQHRFFDSLTNDVARLLRGLDDRGILDDTLVVVTSEFTRTPRLNSGAGKDHWPHASCLLFGGPIRRPSVLGGTNDRLESQPVDYVTGEVAPTGHLNKYDNVAAGILTAFDVDPEPWLPGVVPFAPYLS